jgi:hypothetical protein
LSSDENKEVKKGPFIENKKPQFSEDIFDMDEPIVIYIDSSRFMPENTSMTKVTLRGINADSDQVIGPSEGF